ncbi:MAG: Mur ligase family protein, partial [Myxococcota bacterium]|nr:Mur ligase family protein [Myxococcota bacterium]
MDIAEAEAWLAGLINVERLPDLRRARLSLAPVRALVAALGDPQRGLRVLHVAGSKGKGSTAMLAEALLREAGLRTGVFTSPHLLRWTERFRIDGAEVDGALLADALTRLRPHVERLREGEDAPSFFDATTAAGLLLFAEAEVDVAVLEVGLGGRLDSTNVVDPAVTCITSIELEHAEKLGSTLAAIAGEKAGIAKPGAPLVTGPLPPEAMEVAASRAAAVGAPLVRAGADFRAEVLEEEPDATRFAFRDGPVGFEARLAWPGAHQVDNAGVALAAVRRLGVVDDDALPAVARAALARVQLAARAEILGRRPWLVVDGAHTAASVATLARVLARLPRRRAHLVLSVSAGKDLGALCRALVPQVQAVTVTRAEPVRSLQPTEVADAVRALGADVELRVVPNPHLAVRAAREALGPDDLLCATGSVYLAGRSGG